MSLRKAAITNLQRTVSIAPLVVYRILFGGMVLYGCLWSVYKEDIKERYLEPTFFFKYYGFEWVGFVGETGIYIIYGLWFLAAIGIILGLFYRWSIWCFFILFGYLQLLDATNYINHYYAISILALFLALLPANAACSVDAWRKPALLRSHIPYWQIRVFQFQIALIYTFAAIAKMNPDWLFSAMPLKIWLLQRQDFLLFGGLFQYHLVHLIMSWIGLLFDLTIVWWLLYNKTRIWAYLVVVVFHITTGLLLNIGLFPVLMIFSTTLFFPPATHLSFLQKMGVKLKDRPLIPASRLSLRYFFIGHFIIQLLLPLRHQLYAGNSLWTEEGYRFSWWVMLLEKDGMATFYVKDPASDRQWEVSNNDFLTPFQEKRMAVRPDHILQYAHHLAAIHARRYEIEAPIVWADVHVAMNGRVSQRLINPKTDLAKEERSFWQKDWVLAFEE